MPLNSPTVWRLKGRALWGSALIGAGTVLEVEEVHFASICGKLVVSPTVVLVIKATKMAGLLSIRGMTQANVLQRCAQGLMAEGFSGIDRAGGHESDPCGLAERDRGSGRWRCGSENFAEWKERAQTDLASLCLYKPGSSLERPKPWHICCALHQVYAT